MGQKTNTMEKIETKDGMSYYRGDHGYKHGGAWGAGIGGVIVGGIAGYLIGQNKYGHGGHYGHGGGEHGRPVTHFELSQSEKIARLEAEISEKKSELYTTALVERKVAEAMYGVDRRIAETKEWSNCRFIHQPKVEVCADPSFVGCPTAAA